MRKLVLFMHVSLDGFVTDSKGGMSWVSLEDEMFDIAGEQTDNADTALYGRVTFQMMDDYWPTAGVQPNASKHDIQHSSWYNQVEKVALSKTLKESELKNVKVISGNITEEITKLKQKEGKNIIMFGSPRAAHSLMAENLIDEYWIFVNPLLLGEGTPLFKGIHEKQKLQLQFSKVFSNGVVCLHYKTGL